MIVAARNARSTIGRLLDALEAQTAPRTTFELVVVDDASTDGMATDVRKRGWPAPLVSRSRLGPAGARNLAARHARAELLAITDADCVPDGDWIERGLARFAADPGLSMLGGQVTISLPERPSLPQLLDAATYLTQEGNVSRGWAVTASLWIRRDAFERAGGFNERLTDAGGEDLELGLCVTSAGGRIAYAPEVRATHPPRSTLRATARKAYRTGRGAAELRRNARVPVPVRAAALDVRSYLPRTALRRHRRLRSRGIELGRARRAQMAVVETAFMSAPKLAGDLVGSVRFLARRSARR